MKRVCNKLQITVQIVAKVFNQWHVTRKENDPAKGKINDSLATNPPHFIRPYIHMHVE